MFADCHIHMILDGIYYKTAIERHQKAPVDSIIRETLAHYQAAGVTMLRDGPATPGGSASGPRSWRRSMQSPISCPFTHL